MVSQILKKEGNVIHWLFAFLYWETLTHAAMYDQFLISFRFALVFGCAIALLIALLMGFLPRKWMVPVNMVLTVLITVVYGSQMVYNFIFGTPYSVAQMGLGAGAVSQFWRETLTTMTENWPWIAALLVPLIALIILSAVCKQNRQSWKSRFFALLLAVVMPLLTWTDICRGPELTTLKF